MYSSIYLAQVAAALFASANAHGVILAAQGTAGSPTSVGMGGEQYNDRDMIMNAKNSVKKSSWTWPETAHWSRLANKILVS